MIISRIFALVSTLTPCLLPPAAGLAVAGEVILDESFRKQLDPAWKWIREDAKAWRLSDKGLEVRMLPGNMWGPPNDAKNVLVRPAPAPGTGAISITADIENQPASQYEQVDLVWYSADSHMVKLGQEQVDGKLCIVMGREENDRTRTVKIIPISARRLKLRLLATAGRIRGQFQPEGSEKWEEVGECEPSIRPGTAPQISLQFYQGPANAERWAAVRHVRIERMEAAR